MIGNLFRELAGEYQLTIASGAAYGYVQGCFVTLTETVDYRRISIYVGGQEQTPLGLQENLTTSCARQILHMIATASGADNHYALLTTGSDLPALVLNHAGSVVTVNFAADDASIDGVKRFVTEMLPQVAPLTRPAQCVYCCQMTAGDACPIQLAADTVVPMHVPCFHQASGQQASAPDARQALLRGVGGTVLGALVGALIWAFCHGVSPLLWALAILLGLLPCGFWLLFKGPDHTTQHLIITAISSFCAALLGSIGATLLHAHQQYIGNLAIMQQQSIGEAAYWGALFNQGGLLSHFLTCLLIGLIGAAAGFGLFLLRKKNDAAATKLRRLKGTF